jgi:ubiquinone/menaquinone biosynthesis C-methylase UbiE
MSAVPNPFEAMKAFKTSAWTSTERARVYDASTNSKTDFTSFLTDEYLGQLTRRIAPRSRVLDMGCGTGVLVKALAASGFDAHGVDISQAMLDKIRPEADTDRLSLQQGDVYALPYADASFAGVTTRWVIPHFRDWPVIVKEAARVLQPGGTLVFDHTSRSNYELANRNGVLDHAKFGYDNRVQGGDKTMFYASASIDELQLAADSAGLDLVDVAPLGFFRQNAVMASVLGGEGFLDYKASFDDFYRDPGARAFIQWFERQVTGALPFEMTNGMAVVMQKRG